MHVSLEAVHHVGNQCAQLEHLQEEPTPDPSMQGGAAVQDRPASITGASAPVVDSRAGVINLDGIPAAAMPGPSAVRAQADPACMHALPYMLPPIQVY